VAVLIADTGYELYAACETVRDLDQLYAYLGMVDESPEDAMSGVCDPELPEPADICWESVMPVSIHPRIISQDGFAWQYPPILISGRCLAAAFRQRADQKHSDPYGHRFAGRQ
jgi:hypothetical protein